MPEVASEPLQVTSKSVVWLLAGADTWEVGGHDAYKAPERKNLSWSLWSFVLLVTQPVAAIEPPTH